MDHPCDGLEGAPDYKIAEDINKPMIPKGLKAMFYLVAVPSYFEKGLSRYHVY